MQDQSPNAAVFDSADASPLSDDNFSDEDVAEPAYVWSRLCTDEDYLFSTQTSVEVRPPPHQPPPSQCSQHAPSRQSSFGQASFGHASVGQASASFAQASSQPPSRQTSTGQDYLAHACSLAHAANRDLAASPQALASALIAATGQPLPPALHGDPLNVHRVAHAAAAEVDMCSAERATLEVIRNLGFAATLADPDLPDCPLIGCSDGFESMTGYKRSEIIGRNCRFLNSGVNMDPAQKQRLWAAAMTGNEFTEVLPNLRKDGSSFQNLLHMVMITVRGKPYIVGVQADATNADIDLLNAGHVQALRTTAEAIFAGNIDAWIQMQAREFSMRLPVAYSVLLKLCAPEAFSRQRVEFATLGGRLVFQKDRGAVGLPTSASPRSAGAMSRLGATGYPGSTDDGHTWGQTAMNRVGAYGFHGPTDEGYMVESLGSVIKSAGSVGHPHACTECSFFCFSPGGCRAGVDCRFCHEFHPRKNPKKNRRLLRKLVADHASTEESSSNKGDAETEFGSLQAACHQAFHPDAKASARPPQATFVATAASQFMSLAYQHTQGMYTPPAPIPPIQSSIVRGTSGLAYAGGGRERQHVTLVAGLGARLPAHMAQHAMDHWSGQVMQLFFTAQPRLPKGLYLDSKTGLIKGVPAAPQKSFTYTITCIISPPGTAGLSTGSESMLNCHLSISVTSLQGYTISSTFEEDDGGLALAFEARDGH